MRSVKQSIAFLLGLSMLSACATAPRQGPGEGNETSAVAVNPELILPDVELTPDILNDLLVAEIALQRNRFDTAASAYRLLAKETQDPRIAERATRIALNARDYKAAAEAARLWMALAPQDVEGRQILTMLLVKSGDQDAAVRALEEVLASRPGMSENERYLMIIRLLGRGQDKQVAMDVVGVFLERHPGDAAALFAYSQLALRAGKLDAAEAAVDELLKSKPDWTQAIILRTRLLQTTNRQTQAIEYLGSMVAKYRQDTKLRVAYGRMLVDAEKLKEALEQFEAVLKAAPDNTDILFASGLVALRLDRLDDAKKYFLRLNRESVRVNETSYYLGLIEEERQNYERAMYWYSAVSRGENYLNAQIRNALLQARTGDVDGARAHLGAVQARDPRQRLRLYLVEGEILRDIALYDDAKQVYNRALEEVPANTELLYARAMVAEKLGQIDSLERDLLAILEREPDHVDALNSLGFTLADRTNRYDEAFAYIKRALELRPDAAYIMDSMGWVYYRLGKMNKALDYLRRALALNQDAEIAAHLGEVLWVTGDRERARETWDRALELAPKSAILLNTIKRMSE